MGTIVVPILRMFPRLFAVARRKRQSNNPAASGNRFLRQRASHSFAASAAPVATGAVSMMPRLIQQSTDGASFSA